MADAMLSTPHRREIQRRHREKMVARRDDEIPYPAEKRCSRCRRVKPAEAFSLCRSNRDGLKTSCKQCLGLDHLANRAPKVRKRRISARQLDRLGLEIPAPPVEEALDGPIMRVPLTQGAFAVIDATDWPLVATYTWELLASGYAAAQAPYDGCRQRLVYMHVLIHGDAEAPEVDHRDLDKLNNRRGNLRTATRPQNAANRRKQRNNRGRFKGVRQLPSGRWEARVGNNGKKHSIGTFDTEQEAAAAYDEAAVCLFGEFARPNGVT